MDDGVEHSRAGRMALPASVAAPWRLAPWRPALGARVAALLFVLLGLVLALGLVAELSSSASAPSAVRFTGAARGRLSSLPAGAQGPVSAALGSADPRYRVGAASGGFEAVNPAQRLRVRFERSGVQLSSGAAHLGLSLDGVGYEGSLRAAGDVLSGVQGNRVTYTGDTDDGGGGEGLSEWYANGPLGLEQGFTVARAPAGAPSGPLTLSLALSGDVHAALAPGGRSVVLSSRGGPALRYGDLVATDAQGQTLPSRLVLQPGRILLRVDARGARYPLRIDPMFTQQAKLADAKADGGNEEEQGEGRFGTSVALSADGDTALIGAPGDGGGAGAVWVFTRSGVTWTQQGPKLTGGKASTDAAECEIEELEEEEAAAGECGFGKSLALSADGDTALIGAPGDGGGAGAVWVFTREGTTWTPQESLTGGVEERLKGHFGRGVALSTDGNTAVIGAPGNAGYKGAAWVFTRSGSQWSKQAQIVPANGSGATHFGRSVALSSDGDTVLIGAPWAAGRAGAAWVFTREGTTWSEQEKLMGDEESEEGRFGYSVALSSEGATALVGGRAAENNAGAAWVFTREGTTWSEQEKLTSGEGSGKNKFGYSVALSANGNTALIGGPHASNLRGPAAWVFTRSGSTSAFNIDETLAAGGAGGMFAAGVALSAGGEAALVGVPGDGRGAGAAWAFMVPEPPPTGGGGEEHGGGSGSGSGGGSGGGGTEPPKTSGGGEEHKPDATGGNGGGSGSGSGDGAVLAFGPASGPTCGVSPSGKNIAVSSHGRAALRLIWKGAGGSVAGGPVACRGKLTLEVKVRAKAAKQAGSGSGSGSKGGKQRFRMEAIGTAGFSIAPGGTALVTIDLNAAGRVLLAAGHGRLNASLVILNVSPGPVRSQSASVSLALAKRRRS